MPAPRTRQRMASASLPRLKGTIVRRQQLDELEYEAHGVIPRPARKSAADAHDDDVGAIDRSARPQHPAGPEHREGDRAKFERSCRLHGVSPMAETKCHRER